MDFRDILRTKTKDWFYTKIPKVPIETELLSIDPGSAYLHVFLKSMRLVDIRLGFSSFYPAVHSFISLPHRRDGMAIFNTLTTPKNLVELDVQNLNRVIEMDQRLLGPVPYNGGDLKLEVGLFSIKSGNLAKPFLDILSEISTMGGVSYVSTALLYLKPLEKGIDVIIAGKDSNLEIGLAKTFTSMEPGYYIAIRAPREHFKDQLLKVDPLDFKLTYENGKIVDKFPYLVLEISGTKVRDDWFNIPEVSMAYDELNKSLENGTIETIQTMRLLFKRTLLACKDLLLQDSRKIIAKVEDEIQPILELLEKEPTRGSISMKLPTIENLDVKFLE